MRILFTFAGGSGHFEPLVPIARATEAARHVASIVHPRCLDLQLAGSRGHRTWLSHTVAGLKPGGCLLLEELDQAIAGLADPASDPALVAVLDKFDNVSHVDQRTTLFGQSLASPIVLAPTGLCGMAAPRGEVLAARAAARAVSSSRSAR